MYICIYIYLYLYVFLWALHRNSIATPSQLLRNSFATLSQLFRNSFATLSQAGARLRHVALARRRERRVNAS